MNTNEVVDRLYNRFNITKKDTQRLLTSLQQILVEQLDEGQSFTIPELGTFRTHVRSSHISYNPYYDAYMKIPPKRKVQFQPSRDLKKHIEDESTEK